MNFMPPKSPEQLQMEENERVQNEIWTKARKWEARCMAIEAAKTFNAPDAEQMTTQANKIYEWLIQDLK